MQSDVSKQYSPPSINRHNLSIQTPEHQVAVSKIRYATQSHAYGHN